jgi:hypothetical protein
MKLDIRILRDFLVLGLFHHDRVVSTFFSLAPYYINQIEQAVHVLILSAANIGAEKRSVFCKQLEALGRGNRIIWQLDCFLRYAGSGSSINFPAKRIKGI